MSPAGALAPAGLPAAAGGVDVAGGITSVVPGIRKLKKIAYSTPLPAGFKGGRVPLPLPKSSYMQKAVIRVTGNLQIVQPATTASTLAAGDNRSFLDRIEFGLSGSTQPRVLSGVQNDIIDGLDVPAIAPNDSAIATLTAGGTGSTTQYAYRQEYSPLFAVSDQNLYGIPYLGALATNPQIILTFKDPAASLVTITGGVPAAAVATFENGLVELELWRIDLPGPVMPQQQHQVVDGKDTVVEIPGQGLYLESSYLLLTKLHDAQDLTSAGTFKKFRLPIGPDYLRILALVWKGGVLDDETAPLMDRAELVVQQATAIESKRIWEFSNEHKRLFNKARPTGVYVFSGIDQTGTDSDLYVTRELGNFDLDWYGASTPTPPANSRVEVVTQQLVPLSVPGEYL
jgi:hypothetical protein